MEKVKANRLLSLALAGVLAASMTACGGSPGGQTSSAGASAAGASSGSGTISSKQMTLNLWMTPQWKGVFDQTEKGAADGDFFRYVGGEYSKIHPNVKVNVTVLSGADRDTKLSVALQSGTQPNIFEESTFPMKDFVYQGAVVPIDDIVDEQSKTDIDDSIWKACQVKGKTYFYPFSQTPSFYMINEDVFKKAGLKVPEKNQIGKWTPDEFVADLKAIKEKVPEVAPFGFYCKNNQADTWNNVLLRMYGSKFFKEDSSGMDINNDSTIKALTLLQTLVKDGLTEKGPSTQQATDTDALFRAGKIAVDFGSFGNYMTAISSMQKGEILPFNIGLMYLPGESDPLTFSYVYASSIWQNSDPDLVAAAKDFVKFFSTDEKYTKASVNFAPVRNSVWKDNASYNGYYPALQESTKYQVDFTGGIAGYNVWRAAFYPILQSLCTDKVTPQQAAQQMEEKGNQSIQQGLQNSVLG